MEEKNLGKTESIFRMYFATLFLYIKIGQKSPEKAMLVFLWRL